MLVIEYRAIQLDNLLNEMAKEVQLDQTRYDRMISSYEAIQSLIEADEEFFKPYNYEVYPHGSVRIFTTVKPIGKDEFDLDIVLHFKNDNIVHSPSKIYAELKRVLESHKTYDKMLEPKSRVLRLNYAGDFHMDIMTGIQANVYDENKIKVPDRKLGKWVSSNPRGYADWFIDKSNLVELSLLEKTLKAEKIGADNFDNKKPLQRAVQLIKRYRDIYFEKNTTVYKEYKTRSIILTTIAGQLYQGEESIFNTIDNIITKIYTQFSLPRRIKVFNPVNSEEDFTDKWDTEPNYYYAFKNFVSHLYSEWQKLKRENGLIEENNIFKGLFGDKLVERVHLRENEIIEKMRNDNDLGIIRDTGIISNTVISKNEPIMKNTFYGDEENK
ncbi:MAG: nucleotidyltransferase [Saprospiraceae bacterium]